MDEAVEGHTHLDKNDPIIQEYGVDPKFLEMYDKFSDTKDNIEKWLAQKVELGMLGGAPEPRWTFMNGYFGAKFEPKKAKK